MRSIRRANFEVVEDDPLFVVIRDIGPWDLVPTVTNDVETVVQRLFEDGTLTPGKRLFYFDSIDSFDEILIADGRFAGFYPGVHP